jgi:hypothetical protein
MFVQIATEIFDFLFCFYFGSVCEMHLAGCSGSHALTFVFVKLHAVSRAFLFNAPEHFSPRPPPQENAWIFQVVFILFFGSVWAKMVV